MGLIDTTPKIAEYGRYCNRSGQGLTENAKWCYTEYYDLEYNGSQYICDNNTNSSATFQYQTNAEGTAWDYWYGPRRQVPAYNVIRFSIKIDNIDDAYAYSEKTGQIFFAGKNSLYYGYANINDMLSYDTASLIERRRQILLNAPHLETISDSIASFKTDVPALVKDCKVYFTPVQEGSGDPSPDNVRPITGLDGVTVYKTGKNLLDPQFKTVSNNIVRFYYNDEIPLRAGRYTLSCETQCNGLYVYNKDGVLLYQRYDTNSLTFALNSDTFCRFQFYESTGASSIYNCMLELGSEATAYEPYAGTSLTIPFPQTIYGGYVDLVKGEVVEEWSQIASYNGETLPGEWVSDRDVYTAGTSPTIGAQVAYKLSATITNQLTPQTIKTLRDTNNIWSNANGNVEVRFWKH